MKSSKAVVILISLLNSVTSLAQSECNVSKSFYNDVTAVNYQDVICLSKKSTKEKTLFFTFGIWCAPCRHHLPNAIKLSQDYNLDFYVLLIEKENSEKTKQAIDYLQKIDKNIKILVLKDVSYGSKPGKKYEKFLNEITPTNFENIDDMSKYIIINNQGEIIMVTNWKDNKGNDWKDDSKMIKNRIIPVLK